MSFDGRWWTAWKIVDKADFDMSIRSHFNWIFELEIVGEELALNELKRCFIIQHIPPVDPLGSTASVLIQTTGKRKQEKRLSVSDDAPTQHSVDDNVNERSDPYSSWPVNNLFSVFRVKFIPQLQHNTQSGYRVNQTQTSFLLVFLLAGPTFSLEFFVRQDHIRKERFKENFIAVFFRIIIFIFPFESNSLRESQRWLTVFSIDFLFERKKKPKIHWEKWPVFSPTLNWDHPLRCLPWMLHFKLTPIHIKSIWELEVSCIFPALKFLWNCGPSQSHNQKVTFNVIPIQLRCSFFALFIMIIQRTLCNIAELMTFIWFLFVDEAFFPKNKKIWKMAGKIQKKSTYFLGIPVGTNFLSTFSDILCGKFATGRWLGLSQITHSTNWHVWLIHGILWFSWRSSHYN